jgi:CheY-like chemotaxis protein
MPYRAGRVLVVGDDVLIALHLKKMLADLGFQDVRLAYDLVAGRKALAAGSLDLAILDLTIGSALVFPLAADLKARKVPILFSTGGSPSELPPEWSGHPIIARPHDREALAAALAAFGCTPHCEDPTDATGRETAIIAAMKPPSDRP